jgi:hypothetical protein
VIGGGAIKKFCPKCKGEFYLGDNTPLETQEDREYPSRIVLLVPICCKCGFIDEENEIWQINDDYD